MRQFFAVIIGSEILLGRRVDKHFDFLRKELEKKDLELNGVFTIKDDKKLMSETFSLIKNNKDAVMFCFGGIGYTPDDLTREVSAHVFTCNELVMHEEAKKLIENEFKDAAYPHRINMAYLPQGAKLLTNVVNHVPGYCIDERFFFMPGFPQMAHPMVKEALSTYVVEKGKKYTTFKVNIFTREGDLVEFMQEVSKTVELSSLPKMKDGQYSVELMLRSYDKETVDNWSKKLQNLLVQQNIEYKIL